MQQHDVQALMRGAIKAVMDEHPEDPLAFLSQHFTQQAENPSPLLRAYRSIDSFTRSPGDDNAFNNLLAKIYTDLSQSKASIPWVTHEEMLLLCQALCQHQKGGVPKEGHDTIVSIAKDRDKILDKDQVSFGKFMDYIKSTVLAREVAAKAKYIWQGNYEEGEAMQVDDLMAKAAAQSTMPPSSSPSSPSSKSCLSDTLQQLEPQLEQTGSSSISPLQLWQAIFPLALKTIVQNKSNSSSSRTLPDGERKGPKFALEVQVPFSRKLLDGTKTIETRGYALPENLIGQEILLIESQLGGLARHGLDKGHAIGIVSFGSSKKYTSRQEWADDTNKHGVDVDASVNDYGWSEADTKYGWEVTSITRFPVAYPYPLQEEQRLLRSIFHTSSSLTVS